MAVVVLIVVLMVVLVVTVMVGGMSVFGISIHHSFFFLIVSGPFYLEMDFLSSSFMLRERKRIRT